MQKWNAVETEWRTDDAGASMGRTRRSTEKHGKPAKAWKREGKGEGREGGAKASGC